MSKNLKLQGKKITKFGENQGACSCSRSVHHFAKQVVNN
jgi:hypothetical protein